MYGMYILISHEFRRLYYFSLPFQQMFHQGDFQKTCVKCLEAMDTLSKDLLRHEARDNSLRDQYTIHQDRWNKLKEAIDGTLLSLKQLPERWKEYNAK